MPRGLAPEADPPSRGLTHDAHPWLRQRASRNPRETAEAHKDEGALEGAGRTVELLPLPVILSLSWY